jgi:uncharacterized coiled-coil protein SlyX
MNIDERFDALERQIRDVVERLEHLGERLEHLGERLEHTETALLTAIHGYVSVAEARMKKLEDAGRIDGDRLSQLEQRVIALELRLNFPPKGNT